MIAIPAISIVLLKTFIAIALVIVLVVTLIVTLAKAAGITHAGAYAATRHSVLLTTLAVLITVTLIVALAKAAGITHAGAYATAGHSVLLTALAILTAVSLIVALVKATGIAHTGAYTTAGHAGLLIRSSDTLVVVGRTRAISLLTGIPPAVPIFFAWHVVTVSSSLTRLAPVVTIAVTIVVFEGEKVIYGGIIC